MITDAIIEFLIAPVYYLIDNFGLPESVDIRVPDGVFDTLLSVIRPLGYFLPTELIISFLGISFALDHFHILWALFLRLKSLVSIRNFF